jgi:hypothetical protein
MPCTYTREDLAGHYKRCLTEGRPKKFAAELLHQVGLVDARGRAVTGPDRLPALLKERKANASDFDLRVLTEAMLGPDWAQVLKLNGGGGLPVRDWLREEAAAPIGPSVFTNISTWTSAVGGLMQAAILEGYETAEFVVYKLFNTTPARLWEGERMVAVIGPSEPARAIGPGEAHPDMKMSELWVQCGRITKLGGKITITKEAAWADITGGQVLAKAKELGVTMAFAENELAISLLTGQTNNFRLGTSADDAAVGYNTYGATIGGNLVTNDIVNPLQDLTCFIRAGNNFGAMRHPVTGYPLVVKPTTLICPYTLELYARGLIGAESISVGNQPGAPFPAPAGTFPTGVTSMGNPFRNYVTVVGDQWLAARHTATAAAGGLALSDTNAQRWYLGDPKKFATRRVAWDVNLIDLNPSEFVMADQGIVAGQVGDVAVQYQVTNPYAMQRNKVA